MNLVEFYLLPVEDQQQYFGKTYFKIHQKDDDTSLWGWCPGFINRNQAKFQTEPGGNLQGINLQQFPPDFSFPEVGLYNLGNGTTYFQKVPRRQSKKGLCSETGNFRNFSQIFTNKGKVSCPIPLHQGEPWRIRQIKEMFDSPDEFTLADAMIFFKKRRPVSFAINRDFGLSLGIQSKYLNLWYKQILVGEIPSPKEIVLCPSLFQQEVLDHFLPEDINIDGVNL